jgi:hypothetical protein
MFDSDLVTHGLRIPQLNIFATSRLLYRNFNPKGAFLSSIKAKRLSSECQASAVYAKKASAGSK